MRRITTSILLGLVLAVTLGEAPAAAAPEDCLVSGCEVAVGAAVFGTDGSNQIPLRLTIRGVSQLSAAELFLTLGPNTPANPVTPSPISSVLPPVSATQDQATGQIVVVYADSSLRVTVRYTLSASGNAATVDYVVQVDNLSDAVTALALVNYVDFDLGGDAGGETAVATNGTTIDQSDDDGSVARILALNGGAQYFDVGECCANELFARVVNGRLSDDPGPFGPGDATGSFQSNILINGGGTFAFARRWEVLAVLAPAAAPSLAPLGLAIALAVLVGLGGIALRRPAA